YRSDVEKYYQNQTAGSDRHPTAEQATTVKLGILKELIENVILMHRAEKLGLLATDEEVDRKLTEIKSPYSQEQFDQKLKEKKIQQLMNRLASGHDFATLAVIFSEDTKTSSNGGDL